MTWTPANVTIKDVARRAGVSSMTVSRVINRSERVSAETRRRVEDAIAELGYVPSRLARGLIRQKTGTLALIVPDVANPFFTLIVRGAEDVARRAGYRMLLCDTRSDLALEREVIEEMIAHRVEGIAIAPVSDRSRSHLLRLREFGVQFVLIDRTVPDVECDVVVGDNAGGAWRLVEHLIGLGHTRIGLIVESDEVSTARDRHHAYVAALEAAGIPVEQELIVRSTVDPEGGRSGAAPPRVGRAPDRRLHGQQSRRARRDRGSARRGPRGSGRHRPRVLRRHRVRLTALPVPHCHGAAGRDTRQPGNPPPSEPHRGTGPRAAPCGRSSRTVHRPAILRRRERARVRRRLRCRLQAVRALPVRPSAIAARHLGSQKVRL